MVVDEAKEKRICNYSFRTPQVFAGTRIFKQEHTQFWRTRGKGICLYRGRLPILLRFLWSRYAKSSERADTRQSLSCQVHDELIIEAPEDEADEVAILLKAEMENACHLSVKLVVRCSQGKDVV